MKSKTTSNSHVRDSGIELMRLFAIFSVLMYHFISFYTKNYSPDNQYGYALWLPFRTAVTLFVFISGFYRIHFSLQGFLRLVIKTIVLFTPIELLSVSLAGGGINHSYHVSCPFRGVHTGIY